MLCLYVVLQIIIPYIIISSTPRINSSFEFGQKTPHVSSRISLTSYDILLHHPRYMQANIVTKDPKNEIMVWKLILTLGLRDAKFITDE